MVLSGYVAVDVSIWSWKVCSAFVLLVRRRVEPRTFVDMKRP